jgi:hypothetical protein
MASSLLGCVDGPKPISTDEVALEFREVAEGYCSARLPQIDKVDRPLRRAMLTHCGFAA